MKIAITGASGHIGNNICRLLETSGHEINVMVHKNIDGLEELPVKIARADILNKEQVADFVAGMDIVIHLAAIITMYKKDEQAKKINIEGTQHVIDACLSSNIKRLIHFSSIDALNQLPLTEPIDEKKEFGHTKQVRI